MVLIVLAAVGAFLYAKQRAEGPNEAVKPPPTGLPHTPDYHSLLVDLQDPSRLLLGTHVGIYETTNGGRSWTFAGLEGDDAMNLVQPSEATIWLAGHNVLKRSSDGGKTWEDVHPEGLPGLDVHGFAADPRFRDASVLYAAVAGEGLYRSEDGGRTFEQVSRGVGPAVYGLSVTAAGYVLAAEQRGLRVSYDGGRTWTLLLEEPLVGVSARPGEGDTILATGAAGIFRSTDVGRTWTLILPLERGAGPIAWAGSEPDVGYAVGLDRRLYRTRDAGVTWSPVT